MNMINILYHILYQSIIVFSPNTFNEVFSEALLCVNVARRLTGPEGKLSAVFVK